jgi:hypothetical protein
MTVDVRFPLVPHNPPSDILKRRTFDVTVLYAAAAAIHAVEQREPLPWVSVIR